MFFFKVISFFVTSPYVTRASYIHGPGLDFEVVSIWCCGLMVSASFIPKVAKKQFNKLAFSFSSTARDSSSRFRGPIGFQALGWVATIDSVPMGGCGFLFLRFFVISPPVSLFGFNSFFKHFEFSIHFELDLFINPWGGHAACFHNCVWCVLITNATEQLLPGPQGILFVLENCCDVKWYSINIRLKFLVITECLKFLVRIVLGAGFSLFSLIVA